MMRVVTRVATFLFHAFSTIGSRGIVTMQKRIRVSSTRGKDSDITEAVGKAKIQDYY